MKYFAGIGSRDCPDWVVDVIDILSKVFVKEGLILRGGGATGSDDAFEMSYIKYGGEMEIYLPFEYFYGRSADGKTYLHLEHPGAYRIAKEFHPVWDKLLPNVKDIMARNSHQVLGKDLGTPSDFICCYTKNGKEHGGTGQALRIARHFNIPILNIGCYNGYEEAVIGILNQYKELRGKNEERRT